MSLTSNSGMNQATPYGLDPPHSVHAFTQGESDMMIHKGEEKAMLGSETKATSAQCSPLRGRALKLAIFVALEILWLGFGLYAGLHSPTIKVHLLKFASHRFSSDVVSKSGLSFIANMYQLGALVLAGGIISEAFASEWKYLLGQGMIEHDTKVDRVSLLTSGFWTKFSHFRSAKSSTKVFRLAFFVSLLLPLLNSVMIGTVSIGPSTNITIADISIGSLPAISTFAVDETDRDARLLQLAARNTYAVEIDSDFLNFDIESATPILFGMPSRNLTQNADFITYSSDAILFNYECQWIAPTFDGFFVDAEPGIMNSLWSLDDSGVECTVDPISSDVGNSLSFQSSLYGFWPLVNANNYDPFSGSLAWLLLGGNSTTPLSVLNISSIPEDSRTFNASGWFDLIDNRTEADAYLTTLASVLLCDPNTQFRSVQVTSEFGDIDSNDIVLYPLENGGQIDHTGAAWMLGLGLDGIPFDSVLTQLPLFNETLAFENNPASSPLTDMSRLVFELAFQTPEQNGLGATPQGLKNISRSLNNYMTIVGANVFLDGSLGNISVLADVQTSDTGRQQLIISWPFWLTGVILLFVVSTLLTVLVASEGGRSEALSVGKVAEELERRNGLLQAQA